MKKLVIFVSLYLIFNIILFGQPVANFTSNDSIGCGALIVHFNNLSVNDSNQTFFWDFGNGKTSEEVEPITAFTEPGFYTVTLIVYQAEFSDTIIKTDYIKVYNKPKANFYSNDNVSGCPPLKISLINNSVIGDSLIVYQNWDFGDGSFSDSVNGNHTYQEPGNYTIILTITDANGCSSNHYVQDYINVYDLPEINFEAELNKTCNDSLLVQFNNLSGDIEHTLFEWNFGDETTSEDINASHLFTGFGKYSIQLRAINEHECTDSLLKSDYVILQYLKADISLDDYYYCKYTPLNFINNSIGATNHFWDFGDSTFSGLAIPNKSYSLGGKFNIKYIASYNNICGDTIIDSVFIDPIEANFINSQNYICQLPQIVNYIDQSSNAVSWHWLFGNGEESNLQNPELFFEANSQLQNNKTFFSDTLIVTSSLFCKDTLIKDTNISVLLPKIYFTPNDSIIYSEYTSGCLPLTIDFRDKSISSFSDDEFVEWLWDFNDGNTSNRQNIIHTFNQEGIYNVKLVITNESGCKNEYSSVFRVGTPQIADFYLYSDNIVCGSTEVQFIDNSTIDSLIDERSWLFGDGTVMNTKNALHTFTDTGYMSASLTVFDKGCMGTTMFKDSIIKIKAPAGTFSYTIDCDNPFFVEFNSDINGSDSLIWDFGDGFSDFSNSAQVIHEYGEVANYNINLTAYNINTGCNLELNSPISIRYLKGNIDFSPTLNCLYDTIIFDASASTDVAGFFFNGQFGNYLWDFGNLNNDYDTITLNSVNHIFSESGVHTITLKVKDVNNCWQQIDTLIHIYNPDINFSADTNTGCLPLDINFLNNSSDDTTIIMWQWNFGDGFYSNASSPVHTYSDTGWYSVQLLAADTLGCTDSMSIDSLIFVSKPYPSFSILNQNICLGDTIKTINNSVGNGVSFKWDFGEGSISNLENPIHVYSDSGFYNITLYCIDSLGCDSVITKNNFIYVQEIPVADFSVDLNNISCYPALLKFEDKSESNHITNWQWNFGDGNVTYNNATPFHNYFIPGIFNIELIVRTNLGCSDTIIKNNFINIGGPFAEIFADDSSCINLPVPISMINTKNIYNFYWQINENNIFFQDTIYPVYNSFGTKYLTLFLQSDSVGTCNKTIKDSLFIPELIAQFSIDDSIGCVPFNIHLVENSIGSSNFKWDFGNSDYASDSEIDYTYYQKGNYLLKLLIENNIGCKDSVLNNITVNPLPKINLSNDTVICINDTIQINAEGGNYFKWLNNSFISNNSIQNPYVYPLNNTYFIVSVTDSNNCINLDSIFIQVQQKPNAKIINSDTINLIIGEEVQFESWDTLASEFYWFPEQYLSCIYCAQPYAIPLENITYYYVVTDESNCFNISDSVYINVEKKFSVDLPTAFSPNNDGINDVVYIKGWGIKELIEFKIFDVFGKEVFYTNNLNSGWNGTFNNEYLPVGTYYYILKVLNYDNKIRTKQGSIYLIR